MKIVRTALAVSAGVGLAAGGALPASAGSASGGPWSNNGCHYSGSHSNGNGQTWGSNSDAPCTHGWVQIVYRDSKGNVQSNEDSTSWNYGTGFAATVLNPPSGSTMLYSCHAARSPAGNWSVVRKLTSSGDGGCATPP